MWHSTAIIEFFYQSATIQGAEFSTSKRYPDMFMDFMLERKWIHTCHKLLNEYLFTLHLLIAVVINQLPASQYSSKEDLVAQVKIIFLSKYSKFRYMSCFCLCCLHNVYLFHMTDAAQGKTYHQVPYSSSSMRVTGLPEGISFGNPRDNVSCRSPKNCCCRSTDLICYWYVSTAYMQYIPYPL